MTKLTRAKIRAILEHNLRKHRVRGFQYDPLPTTDPSGLGNLKAQGDLDFWKQRKITIEQKTGNLFSLVDDNINLRDAIADTIVDALSGNNATGTYTAGQAPNYLTDEEVEGGDREASNDDEEDIHLEVDSTRSVTLKHGNNQIQLSSAGITITNGTDSLVINGSGITVSGSYELKNHVHTTDVQDAGPPISRDSGAGHN